MSSKSLDKKYDGITIKEIKENTPINFSVIIIPFHQFGKMRNSSYIYDGSGKIPFRERDPVYQAIFRNEFIEEKE
ncbi:MAG: hypothetical protein ACFFG0_09570 [Candidatus Thorarchaeota archaeon]